MKPAIATTIVLLFLTGCCHQVKPTPPSDLQKVHCEGWKPISFDPHKDTEKTLREIRSHNTYGYESGCWPSPN